MSDSSKQDATVEKIRNHPLRLTGYGMVLKSTISNINPKAGYVILAADVHGGQHCPDKKHRLAVKCHMRKETIINYINPEQNLQCGDIVSFDGVINNFYKRNGLIHLVTTSIGFVNEATLTFSDLDMFVADFLEEMFEAKVLE